MIDAPKFIRSIYHLEDKVIFIILPFEDNIIVPFKSVLYVSIFIFFKEVKIKPENVFILACRDLEKGEIELINELKMHVWTTEQINKEGTSKVINDLLTLIKEKNIKNIHSSYYIDCLDPDYVPGTGTPVNDGLTYSQSKELLEVILGTSLVKSMDFVEYNPMLDKNNKTKETCFELLNLISDNL